MRAVRRLVHHHDELRRLDDARQAAEVEERDADRHAVRERAVLAEVLRALEAQRSGPRQHVFWLQCLRDVVVVAVLPRAAGLPDARQIGLAVGGARHGRRQIRTAVRQTRNARRLVVDPLSGRRQRQCERESFHPTLLSDARLYTVRFRKVAVMKLRWIASLAVLLALTAGSLVGLAQRKVELMPGPAGIPVAPKGLWPNGTGKKLPTTPMIFDTAE